MGKLLNSYLQSFGPSLQSIAQGGQARQPQPRGMEPAQTFPMGERSAPQLQFSPPTVAEHRPPMSPPRGSYTPISASQPEADQALAPTFSEPQSPQQQPAQVDTSQLQPFRERRDDLRKKDPSEINTFDELWASASDKERESGAEILAQQLGGEEGMNQAYARLTGQPPDDRLTKADKAQLLMEFGLRTLAHNDQMGGFGAIGRAGAETLGMARGMRQAKREAPAKAHKAELENRLLEAQIKKAESDPTELTSDAEGRLILINKSTGASQVITDSEGNPITSPKEAGQFASQVDRQAYEAAFCEGLTGDAARSCKQRALAFSKGGAAEIAFPELQRQQLVLRLMTRLEDVDNQFAQYTLPSGEKKRWRDMSEDEKLQIGDQLIDRWNDVIRQEGAFSGNGGNSGAVNQALPTGYDALGLSEDIARQIPRGNVARMTSGRYIANIGGRLVETDENGRPINEPK